MITTHTETTTGTMPAQPPRIELNGPAPNFTANTTHGQIDFYDWKGESWALLFSHPADFTPVCTTEFVEFTRLFDEFQSRGVKLIGNSIDSIYAHVAWVRNIEQNFGVEVPFPVIADLDQKVSRTYGMLHEPSSVTATVRCVYFIDPKHNVRAMIYYPLNVGRNFEEILRVIDALQMVDKFAVAAPANWKKGHEVIVPPPVTVADAKTRLASKEYTVTDWYFSKRQPVA